MKATILEGDTVLGTGVIQHLDPPMGVAFGRFIPSELYSAHLHANTIDGEHLGYKGAVFVALVDNVPVQTAAISIKDYSKTLGEYHFTIWFRDGIEYFSLFQNHPAYTAYYSEPS